MTKTKQIGLRKLLCMLFALCIATVCLLVPASAAGAGYSDVYRVYSVLGLNRNTSVNAMAYMYGTASSTDNYVVVIKTDDRTEFIYFDVVTEAEFNQITGSALQTTQMDVSTLNQYLLENGAPDYMLILEEKPYIVEELEKTFAQGQPSLTAKDAVVVFPDTLKWAAQQGGAGFRINFDSTHGNSVDVRLTVDPSQATKGFATLANAVNLEGHKVIGKLGNIYSNKMAAVDFLQQGSFGMSVEVAARVDLSGLNTGNLMFQSYDIMNNSMTRLEDVSYSIDEAGYLHFSTSIGGTIVITDSPLVKK